MTDGAAIERPVLWGQTGPPVGFSGNPRNEPKVDLPSRGRQAERLGEKFDGLEDAFQEQVALTQSLGASDPQLVLVFEAIDERVDLTRVAELAGLEILTEIDRDFEPDGDFPRRSVDQDLPVTGCLHAVCVNQQAKANVVGWWRAWQSSGTLPSGYAPLRDLFAHLKDVRAWGPQDRVRVTELALALEGMLPGEHEVEIELWFRRSQARRQKAEDEVAELVMSSGGDVLSSAQVPEVGYHGMKCRIPVPLLQRLATGDFDAVAAVKSSHVMYMRAAVQSQSYSSPVSPLSASGNAPAGEPVLCLLDGVPAANHPLLAGRVILTDPDDLSADTATSTELRKHGTAMASVCVWGDRSNGEGPAPRPILVRPILTPATDTQGLVEELKSHELAPDLMRRVFRELFDGNGSVGPTGSSVVVMNLSVADPGAPFDGLMSSWARTIDWLSAEYGVVVVVSAGNHGTITTSAGAKAVTDLVGEDRAHAINAAVATTVPRRSLLSPAESINAVSVGALNADGAAGVNLGYRVDPGDGRLIVSPISALGAGYKRAVKPDLIAPGGRTLVQTPVSSTQSELFLAPAAAGPGVRVAGANGSSEVFTTGTSPAAASVSRDAARAVDVVLDIAPRQLSRSELAVSTKALLAHTARIPSDLITHAGIHPYAAGYGVIGRSLADGCPTNEAVVLYVGNLGANEQRALALPIPSGLQQRGVKRVTATLAWLSPVNWRHRQYRRAALDFAAPTGFTNLGSTLDVPGERAKRGTLQHAVWEVSRAVAGGSGSSIDFRVQCKEQAGGLDGDRVDFAVVVSLWVAPELGVDVHSQVTQQLVTPVVVTP